MPATSPHSLAILGAGPIGLEAAALALELGFDVHVFERATPGAHVSAWGHVRMFTPWHMDLGPASVRLLARHGWSAPPPDECPTGHEFVDRVLLPLAATPELKARVHAHQQVVAVSRHGARKADLLGDPTRAAHPFRILVRDAGGRESFLHAHAVLDTTGTYGQPNAAGTGGIPARGESYLAPQMSHHLDDVLGIRRDRHAGRTTLVIGGGASAITTVTLLAQLAAEVPGTRVTWVTRRDTPGFAHEAVGTDPLPSRAALHAEGRRLQSGADEAVRWVGGAEVEGFEYNSATHRYRVQLATANGARIEECDQVIANTGYGPDASLYRELQVHECYASLAPMKLAAARLEAGGDCMTVPAFGADLLANPEPNFFILGAKSHGRDSQFLLRTGYQQVGDVLAELARRAGLAATPA